MIRSGCFCRSRFRLFRLQAGADAGDLFREGGGNAIDKDRSVHRKNEAENLPKHFRADKLGAVGGQTDRRAVRRDGHGLLQQRRDRERHISDDLLIGLVEVFQFNAAALGQPPGGLLLQDLHVLRGQICQIVLQK